MIGTWIDVGSPIASGDDWHRFLDGDAFSYTLMQCGGVSSADLGNDALVAVIHPKPFTHLPSTPKTA